MNNLTPAILAQMKEAAGLAMANVRDRETMKAACAEMDRISEEVRKKHGVLEIGVAALRELRDGE